MNTVSFTIFATPRTKKTHSRIAGYGRPCYVCRRPPYSKVIPSESFLEFEDSCFKLGPAIRRAIERNGAALPIAGPVTVRALFFREAYTGDFAGYIQALGDVLEEAVFEDGKCRKKGMGIIRNDRQIAHWDGTRLLKDAARPRIEVEIMKLEAGLFE